MEERLSIAPMMEVTDAHYRSLLRSMSRNTVLYSEMIVDDAINHTEENMLDFFLGKNIDEEPSVIQIGGWNPETMSEASYKLERYGGGYGEININCGCPSPKVSKRSFGAKLMLEPNLVREIVQSMVKKVSVPVTVKCRLGVAKERESYEELKEFITAAHSGGANKFIIHSRNCVLKGLTPKQNRDIPPLRYDVVHRLVQEFPDLQFVLNGGITTFESSLEHMNEKYNFTNTEGIVEELPGVHGIMIGRAAQSNPMIFAKADSTFWGVKDTCLTRREILENYFTYCEKVQSVNGPKKRSRPDKPLYGVSSSTLIKPLHNFMSGVRNNQIFKRVMNETYVACLSGVNGSSNPAVRGVVMRAMEEIDDEILDEVVGIRQEDLPDKPSELL
jgi:tRNA-dihydrouridine synthase A